MAAYEVIGDLDIDIRVGDRFYNFKNPDVVYEVIALASNSDTLEDEVIYGTSPTHCFSRTLREFKQVLRLNTGEIIPRFVQVK